MAASSGSLGHRGDAPVAGARSGTLGGLTGEQTYLEGVAAWAARDVDAAVSSLSAAIDAGTGEWWEGVAGRALAQVSLEIDDLDLAERTLRAVPLGAELVESGHTDALRGRLELARGQTYAAALTFEAVLTQVLADDGESVAALVNGAIALAIVAEGFAELGDGAESLRNVELAKGRVQLAAEAVPELWDWLVVTAAAAARLEGLTDQAVVLLTTGRLTAPTSPEAAVRRDRELARLARDAGDGGAASLLYGKARARALSGRFDALAASLALEVEGAGEWGRPALPSPRRSVSDGSDRSISPDEPPLPVKFPN